MQKSFGIHVSELPREVASRDLHAAFEKYGEIVSARVVCDHFSGVSRGFGFVNFASEGPVLKAIVDGKVPVRGFACTVRKAWNTPDSGGGGAASSSSGATPSSDPEAKEPSQGMLYHLERKRTLFIHGIPESNARDESGLFAQLEDVLTDKIEKLRCDFNWCLVTFKDFPAAERALIELRAQADVVFPGRTLRIEFSRPGRNDFEKQNMRRERRARTVYVKGFAKDTEEASLRRKFDIYGNVEHVKIFDDPEKHTYPFAFIEFSLRGDAIEAVRVLDQTEFHGKTITVRCAQPIADEVVPFGVGRPVPFGLPPGMPLPPGVLPAPYGMTPMVDPATGLPVAPPPGSNSLVPYLGGSAAPNPEVQSAAMNLVRAMTDARQPVPVELRALAAGHSSSSTGGGSNGFGHRGGGQFSATPKGATPTSGTFAEMPKSSKTKKTSKGKKSHKWTPTDSRSASDVSDSDDDSYRRRRRRRRHRRRSSFFSSDDDHSGSDDDRGGSASSDDSYSRRRRRGRRGDRRTRRQDSDFDSKETLAFILEQVRMLTLNANDERARSRGIGFGDRYESASSPRATYSGDRDRDRYGGADRDRDRDRFDDRHRFDDSRYSRRRDRERDREGDSDSRRARRRRGGGGSRSASRSRSRARSRSPRATSRSRRRATSDKEPKERSRYKGRSPSRSLSPRDRTTRSKHKSKLKNSPERRSSRSSSKGRGRAHIEEILE